MALRLVEPGLPAHLTEQDGFLYADIRVTDEAVPDRFAASLAADPDQGPPWATLIAGLESGRFGMRERLERALADGVALEPLKDALEACYYGMFGMRADGPGRADFERWRRTLPPELADADSGADRRLSLVPRTILGCHRVSAGGDTGHVPVDHEGYLYDYAERIPALFEARFEQEVLLDPEDDDAWDAARGHGVAYTLRAWTHGRRYDAPALAHHDYADASSMMGLLNAILRDRGDEHRLVYGDEDGESLIIGPQAAIEQGWARELW